jgi:hypothetical protein
MEKAIELLNRMQADGVIENFAIGDGIAAIYYLEPYNTDDVDVFISPVVVSEGGLVSFGTIYSYLHALGYQAEREYIRIEGWLVQFLPAAESVQEEAVAHPLPITRHLMLPILVFKMLRNSHRTCSMGMVGTSNESFFSTSCGARKKLAEFFKST